MSGSQEATGRLLLPYDDPQRRGTCTPARRRAAVYFCRPSLAMTALQGCARFFHQSAEFLRRAANPRERPRLCTSSYPCPQRMRRLASAPTERQGASERPPSTRAEQPGGNHKL